MKIKILRILLIINICLNPVLVFSTEQVSDKLFFNNYIYNLSISPIIRYFDIHPEIIFRKSELISTNSNRGYSAYYEIIDDLLYLTSINISVRNENFDENFVLNNYSGLNILAEIFHDKEKIPVDWFSGVMILHDRNVYLSNYSHIDFRCVLLEIKNGIIIKKSSISHDDYYPYEAKKFELFKQSDEFIKLKEEISKKHFSGYDKETIDYYSFFKSRHISFIKTIE